MRSVLVVVLLAACGLDPPGGFPDRPPACTSNCTIETEDGPDARPADASPFVLGRVCVVVDLRIWTTGCANTGADGLTVTIGTAVATTTANGSFQIVPPMPAPPRVVVTGPTILATSNPYDPTAPTIVAIAPTLAYWGDLQTDSGFAAVTGLGHALVEVRVDGMLDAGTTAAATPAGLSGAFYDDATPTAWGGPSDATDVNAKALLPNLTPGSTVINALAADLTSMGNINAQIVGDTLHVDRIDIDTTP